MKTTLWGLSPPALLLIAVNLVPLFGVLFRGWEIFPLMALFWAENVVVGLWNLVRMATTRAPGKMSRSIGERIATMAFFTLHYGGFAFGHGTFIAILFGPDQVQSEIGAVINVLGQPGLALALLGLVASHGASYFFNFLGQGEFRHASVSTLMHQPYARVVVLHVALIGSGLLIQALGTPLAGLVFLVVLKIAVDVVAHRREHARLQSGDDRSDAAVF